MTRIEFFSEIRIDKNPDIVDYLITLYWQIFVDKNKKKKELLFVKRSEIVHSAKYNRRNCYKHLRHLLFLGIFKEESGYLIPSALIFKINKKLINPSEIVFGKKIDRDIKNRGIADIEPEISATKINGLSNLIVLGKDRLYRFISLSFGIGESLSFSSSFNLANMPKLEKFIGLWKQKKKSIAKKERYLLKTLNPNKDPFQHDSFIEFRGGDSTPLFELEKNKKTYVIAAWAAKYQYKGNDTRIIGDYKDKKITGSELLFYNENKNFLCKKNFVFPSCKEGIPIADQSTLIFTRKNCIKNKNYIGYYDFKSAGIELKHLLNCIIIHFSKFNIPKKAKFIKIHTGEKGIFTLINIFPLNKLDIGFIKQRMANLNKGKFVQDDFYPLQFSNIKSIDVNEFKKVNEILKKASFISGEEKQILLRQALEKLIDYSYYFKQEALKLAKKGKEINNLIKMIYVVIRGISFIYYCIKEYSEKLNKKVCLSLKDNEKFYNKISPLLIQKVDPINFSVFLETKYDNSFVLFRKGDYSSFGEKLKELRHDIKIIKEPFNKMKIIKKFSNLLKRKIEKDVLSEKTEKYLQDVLWLNKQRAKICNELALKTIKFRDKKAFNQEMIINKYKCYETLSLYFLYQNLLYKAKYYEKTSLDKEKFKDLNLMLNQFKNKIF